MKILFLILFSTFAFADLSRNASGVVSDNQTILEWADSESVSKTWEESIDYCQGLELSGGEWRLANINELLSIMGGEPQSNSTYPNGISTAFENVNFGDEYWSSTTYILQKDEAIRILGRKGILFVSPKTASHEVRCVRDAP